MIAAAQECVGVYIVMVCRWTDHILARNLLLEVEADLPDDGQTISRWWPTISELEIRFVKLKRIFQAEAISPHVFHS